ncbi:MAG: SOS response-associated peptidase [Clostridia bacterium]|nr:SOS response-associated peptidase [Clostridia bacterium]
MCGRYWLGQGESVPELQQILDALQRKKTPEGLKTCGEIFPTDVVPVLANDRRGGVQPFAMRWGYAFPSGRPIINARAETAADKPMFRDGIRQRRCLVPASSYFEWERKEGGKTKYALRPQESEMIYFAGIYHLERYGEVTVPAFAILTREAAPEIRFIHERMPVIIPGERAADWLSCKEPLPEFLNRTAPQMAFREVKPQ